MSLTRAAKKFRHLIYLKFLIYISRWLYSRLHASCSVEVNYVHFRYTNAIQKFFVREKCALSYCRQRQRLTESARYWRWTKRTSVSWRNMNVWLPTCSNGYDERYRGSRIGKPTIPSPVARRSWRSTGRIGASISRRVSNRKPSWRRILILFKRSWGWAIDRRTCPRKGKWFPT